MRTNILLREYFFRNIIDQYNTDVFISTWSEMGYSNKDIKTTLSKQNVSDLVFSYTPIDYEILNFKHEYINEINSIKVPDFIKKIEPNNYKGALPMTYLMHRCNNLKTKYEEKKGFKYDIVIRSRPDIYIGVKLKLKKAFNTIHLKKIHKETFFCDQFAYGDSCSMDYYSNVFLLLHLYWKYNSLPRYKDIPVGERLMRKHLLNSNFKLKSLNLYFPILRYEKVKESKFKYLS